MKQLDNNPMSSPSCPAPGEIGSCSADDRGPRRPGIREARPLTAGTRIVEVNDRRLAVDITGAPDGFPVFLLHGTPGSRLGPKPRSPLLHRMGVCLISYDRPGYGQSTRQMFRRVANAAEDVEAIADCLGLDAFSVLGRSGGGPHALAVAAAPRLAGRVRRTAVMVGLAPPDTNDLDWFGGMTGSNTREFGSVEKDTVDLISQLRTKVDRAQIDPETIVNGLEAEMPVADRKVVLNAAVREQLRQTYAEAVVQGAGGWIDDVMALRSDWGVALGDISCEVRLWHGSDDRFAPVAHARSLAREIPGCVVDVELGAAHFAALSRVPDMIGWLADERPATTRRAVVV